MKFLAFIPLLMSVAYAGVGRQAWHAADLQGKVKLLQAYQNWYAEMSTEKTTAHVSFPKFISEAWASTLGMDCVNAGWPSKRVGGACSSPQQQNPSYQAGSCAAGTLQCQPLFFGAGLCAPAATAAQRSLAFSSCRQQFAASGRNHVEVVTELIREGREEELLELMDYSEGVCRRGQQSRTGMCRRLEEVVGNVREAFNAVRGAASAAGAVLARVQQVGEPAAACEATGPLAQPSPQAALTAAPVSQEGITFTPVSAPPRSEPRILPATSPASLAAFSELAEPCATLRVGQTKVVGKSEEDFQRDPSNALTHADPSAMGVNTSYALTRTSENAFVATVAIDFKAAEGATGASAAKVREMATHARTCMQQLSPGLRGPRGESLEVRIVAPEGEDQNPQSDLPAELQPRATVVNVHSGEGRGRADQFYENFDCATVAHEVMHMLGLVDEYHETGDHGGTCRIETNHVNIMSDLQAAQNQTVAAPVTCVCDENCQRIMGNGNQEQREYFLAPRLRDVMTPQQAFVFCAQTENQDLGAWGSVTSRPAPLSIGQDNSVLRVMQGSLQSVDSEVRVHQSSYVCGCGDATDSWCGQTEGLSAEDATLRSQICERRRSMSNCQGVLARARRTMTNPATLRLRSCPAGSSRLGTPRPIEGSEFALRPHSNGNKLFSFSTSPTADGSMLAPAHFARILAGQCGTGAENYNSCARFANGRNHVTVDADGVRVGEPRPLNCDTDVPAQCREESFFLGLPAAGASTAQTPAQSTAQPASDAAAATESPATAALRGPSPAAPPQVRPLNTGNTSDPTGTAVPYNSLPPAHNRPPALPVVDRGAAIYSPQTAFSDVLAEPLVFVGRGYTNPILDANGTPIEGNNACIYRNSRVYVVHSGCRPRANQALSVFDVQIYSREGGMVGFKMESRDRYNIDAAQPNFQGGWSLTQKATAALSGDLSFTEMGNIHEDSLLSNVPTCSAYGRNPTCTSPNNTPVPEGMTQAWAEQATAFAQDVTLLRRVHDVVLNARR